MATLYLLLPGRIGARIVIVLERGGRVGLSSTKSIARMSCVSSTTDGSEVYIDAAVVTHFINNPTPEFAGKMACIQRDNDLTDTNVYSASRTGHINAVCACHVQRVHVAST